MRSTSLLFGLFLDLTSLEELRMKFHCLYFVSHIELKSRIGVDESWIDIPNLQKIHCFNAFAWVTELEVENADSLASFFQSRAPWSNFENTTPFIPNHYNHVEALTIARGTGNTVEMEELDLTSFHDLRSLHIEERCFLFTKRVLIRGLQNLLSISIGKFCFIVNYELVENSVLSIKDCPSLDSLHIGGGSFCGYSSLELDSLR